MRLITRRKKAAVILVLTAAVVLMSAFNPIDLPNVGSAVPVNQFTNFESAHVHPLDITPDGTKLLAVNTAAGTLEVFQITGNGLLNTASIVVGMDPVTVRVRSNTEAWVVNQVSDDISIVDLTTNRVTRSMVTEDEPADVVFTNTTPPKAFVSCAQRESVQAFNANTYTLITEVLLKGEQPRALAVNGNNVYCAFFESGNQTTIVPGNPFMASGICSVQGGACTVIPNDVTKAVGPYGGVTPVPNAGTGFNPPLNPNNPIPGSQSLIVRKNAAGQWMDDNTHNWTNIVSGGAGVRAAGWDMPDRDVAVIDATNPSTAGVTYQTHLGNILMAMGVNPASGQLNIVGTDATNEIRFEPNLRGKFLRVNISQFTTVGGANTITDLNPHINYANHTLPLAERNKSIGDPRGIAFKVDGSRMYVTGMGSNNVVVLNSNGTRFLADPINVGEGPTGIVLDETRNKAYVLNKFEGSVSSIDLGSNQEVARANFFDPTPMVIKAGRKHLYNTHLGSGNGHIACASCHVDARWDRLGWDLGDPAGDAVVVDGKTFNPMKGVKTTQFLIDIINRGTGNLHWRGDKNGFGDFAGAFMNLQGLDAPKPANEMQEFQDFLAASWYVPNPYRTIRPDSSVAAATERIGTTRVRGTGTSFQNVPSAGVELWVSVNVNCSHCHNAHSGRGDLAGNGNVAGSGPTAGFSQNVDMAPDLRSVYRKNGFYYNTTECTSGFGLMADGVMETWFNGPGTANYMGDYEPELLSWSGGITCVNSQQSCDQVQFPLVGPVQDAMPAVGMRMTINGASIGNTSRVTSLKSWVNKYSTEYALIVKGIYGGEPRGFYYLGSDTYQPDVNGAPSVTHTTLINAALTGTQPLTWMVVHPSTKIRLGVDRDADGTYDNTDKPAMVQVRMNLEGAMTGTTMRHDLADLVLVPATDPGSGAQASPQVLAYTGLQAPVDWVKLELRNSANNTQIMATGAGILQANGNVIMPTGEQTLTFPAAPAGSYYVVIDHRSHLGTMTFSAISLLNMGTQVDFTLPGTATYGTAAQKNISGVMALWAGDVIPDGVIKYTGAGNDRDPILAKIGGAIPTNTVSGYWPEDVNMTGVVKYSGAGNDRDPILVNIGGTVPTATKTQQLP